MSRYLKIVLLSILAVTVIAVGVYWLLPIRYVGAHNQSHAANSLPSLISSKLPAKKGSTPTPGVAAKKRPAATPAPTQVITKRPSPAPTPTSKGTRHSSSRNA